MRCWSSVDAYNIPALGFSLDTYGPTRIHTDAYEHGYILTAHLLAYSCTLRTYALSSECWILCPDTALPGNTYDPIRQF